jgi:hypothetical protein
MIGLKYKDNIIIKNGTDDIDLGTEEKYLCSCYECWDNKNQIFYTLEDLKRRKNKIEFLFFIPI